MEKLSGYDEKQQKIVDKINADLKVLPNIFTQYVSYLKENGKSNSTIHSYLSTLSACLRTIYQNFYLSDETFYLNINSKDITYYFDSKNDLGIKRLQTHWSVLNSFFIFLTNNEYITTNPMQSIRRPVDRNTNRKLNYLNRSELDRLFLSIKYSPTRFTSFRDEIIIKLAISTGIDVADLVNLNFDDIDFSNGTVHIVNKKGERTLPIGNSIICLLKQWNQFRQQYFKENDTQALFVSTQKSRLSVDAITYMLRNYCEKANVPVITFKDLKSTMVYLLAKENVSMEAIMEMLGVSDYLVVVQAYDAAMKENNINITDAINSLFEIPISTKSTTGNPPVQHIFTLELKLPKYATYTNGREGFTLFGNITNITENPIKLKLITCGIFINGMLRASDYAYVGYEFDEEFIFPNTTRTFGKIWITNEQQIKKLTNNDYIMLCFLDINSNTKHHIKYVYKENLLGDYWIEENWYEIENQ